ncbi:MAG: type I restriction endonuclease subunit R [bacterium]|nr:type I restriction endonuclease subunit R [bacterium]
MSKYLNENSLAEQPALDWLKGLGYDIAFGPDLAPSGPFQERDDFRGVILKQRLLRSLRRLNPDLPDVGVEAAANMLIRASEQPDLIFANKEIYGLITQGLKVVYRNDAGEEKIFLAQVFDFKNPLNNEFLAVNQFAIQGLERVRRPDVVLFVNGVPLAVFELKSPTNQAGTIGSAITQLEDYKKDIPALFAYNQIVIVSDLLHAYHGTISSTREWFAEWKFVDDEGEKRDANLEVLISGIFHKARFLDIVQNFIAFEADSDNDAATYTKKMSKYHQYYGVNRAVEKTIKAMQPGGKKKIGVFWHTQGSGKTLSMVFYVNKIRHIEELRSPTVLFLTDRTDLDQQMYKTFMRTGYSALTKNMESIKELKNKLKNAGAEIICTTAQKFDKSELGEEVLSEKDNFIIIADEAHRSQYKEYAGNIRAVLPNASFMGLTGTPISFADRDTRLVFGDFITIYRIDQSVNDNATVPLYYEGRLIPLNLENKNIDEDLKSLLSGELTESEAEHLKHKLARLEGAIGAPDRLDKISDDIVKHFNNRGLEGKGMVVTINRKVAVELYRRISAHADAPQSAVVISGLEEFRDDVQKELSISELEKQFKDAKHPLKLAIVCDMWLTGFDVPALHTMYIDKPLRGHTLMQAIARANRIYKDKPAGLIVDYIGVAGELKKALSLYASDIKDKAIFPLEEAIRMMLEKHRAVSEFFAGVSCKGWGKLQGKDLALLFQEAIAKVLGEEDRIDEDRKKRFIEEMTKLEKLHALVMPHPEAYNIREDVSFFRAVKKAIYKEIIIDLPPGTGLDKETETAIKKLIETSIVAEKAIDLFAAEGKARPEISIFDERFIEEIKKIRFKNLAIEMLRKLLRDELKGRLRINEVRYVPLRELLEEIIEKYENNIISSAEVIEQLVKLAQQIKLQETIGMKLGLSEEELAFYDALSLGKKAVKDDGRLKGIVRDLVKMIRRDVSIDWTNNEVIRSRIQANVNLLLLRNGFSAEETPILIEQIFHQAQLLYADLIH